MLPAIVPSHDFALWILDFIHRCLDGLGLHRDPMLEQILYLIIISVLAIVAAWAVRLALLWIVRLIIKRKQKSPFWHAMLKQKVVTRCSHVITPLVILIMLPWAISANQKFMDVAYTVIYVYLMLMFAVGLSAVITFAWTNYNLRANKDNHPLKGVMNLAKGIVWIVTVICCAAVILHRSPMALLGGMTAFAAVLMLVFKDSILGLVAGLQLSSNDMLRVGDWIVVPNTIANGVVVDVSLTVVKVQNWDNTIVMLPPYSLVSSSFQNWRGMSDSGVRQIDRSVFIDNTTIVPATPALLADVASRYPQMKEYVETRQKEAQDGRPLVFNGGVAPVNGTIDTNLGLYRAYLCKYLLAHPAISHDNNIIVRLMTPQGIGTPLDIYCFTATTDWLAYEAIRSQVFEHIAATAPIFGLRIFNDTDAGRIDLDRSDAIPQPQPATVEPTAPTAPAASAAPAATPTA